MKFSQHQFHQELSDISSHHIMFFFVVVIRFATSQFERELSDCIPPASNFLFLVAVLKTFAT